MALVHHTSHVHVQDERHTTLPLMVSNPQAVFLAAVDPGRMSTAGPASTSSSLVVLAEVLASVNPCPLAVEHGERALSPHAVNYPCTCL